MKKVVITGVTGCIGSAVAKKLLDRDYVVYGIDVNKEKMKKKFGNYSNFFEIKAFFEDYKSLENIIKDKDFDVFYHFAYQGGFTEAVKDYTLQLKNTNAAADAIMLAIKIGCKKFVYPGSINEYEVKEYFNLERFYPRYNCIYSASKLAGDMICKTLAYNNGIKYCGGRVAVIYGEGNYSMTLPTMVIKKLLKGEELKLIEGKNLYDLCYIDDAADGFIAIGEKGKDFKTYYIGHRQPKTFKEWISKIGKIVDKNIKLNFGEFQEYKILDYDKVDLDALYNDTGFQIKTNFEQSIKNTKEWIEKNLL